VGFRHRPPATRHLASLYIGGVWIRLPKGPHMKRLLGLLLVVGMVRCGDDSSPPGDGNPSAPTAAADPVVRYFAFFNRVVSHSRLNLANAIFSYGCVAPVS